MITKPSREAARTVGVDYDEGPPVPIPNTEVKLVRAENTWLVTAREDRCSPTLKKQSPNRAAVFFGACARQYAQFNLAQVSALAARAVAWAGTGPAMRAAVGWARGKEIAPPLAFYAHYAYNRVAGGEGYGPQLGKSGTDHPAAWLVLCHRHFKHATKLGKVTIPANRKDLNIKTWNSIMRQAGLK